MSSNFGTHEINLENLSPDPYMANEQRLAIARGHRWCVTYWWAGVGQTQLYCNYATAQAFQRVYASALKDKENEIKRTLGL